MLRAQHVVLASPSSGAQQRVQLRAHAVPRPHALASGALLQGSHTAATAAPPPSRPAHRARHSRLQAFSGGGPPGLGGPGDPYAHLFSSSVFQNSVVVKEFTDMVNSLMGLSRMASKFPDFDVAGKKMYLEQMRQSSESYQLWIKRLELSEDPAAKEYLRITNAQMLNGGFTLPSMFSGLEQSLRQYESWVNAEEAAIAAGPAAHQAFLQSVRQAWQQTALGAIDTGALSSSIPPEVLVRAQSDPQFWAAVREISEQPTPDVINKWMNSSEALKPLVMELARNILQQQFKRQGL